MEGELGGEGGRREGEQERVGKKEEDDGLEARRRRGEGGRRKG